MRHNFIRLLNKDENKSADKCKKFKNCFFANYLIYTMKKSKQKKRVKLIIN